MDIQIALNWLISIIVMGSVSIIVMDFVNGLFWLPYSYSAIAPVATNSRAIAPIPSVATPESEPQFAQLPDPWELIDIQPTSIQPAVVLEFPTLRLLPSVASVVQTETKATTKSTKSAKPKSTKTSKPKTAVTPRKSRKKSAA